MSVSSGEDKPKCCKCGRIPELCNENFCGHKYCLECIDKKISEKKTKIKYCLEPSCSK